MIERREFHPLQAEEIARAFNEKGVDYLFIGKSGAILLGYPGTTQDVDIPLLESFRREYERLHAPELRSASEIAGGKSAGAA
jgi:hypothetical protein